MINNEPKRDYYKMLEENYRRYKMSSRERYVEDRLKAINGE